MRKILKNLFHAIFKSKNSFIELENIDLNEESTFKKYSNNVNDKIINGLHSLNELKSQFLEEPDNGLFLKNAKICVDLSESMDFIKNMLVDDINSNFLDFKKGVYEFLYFINTSNIHPGALSISCMIFNGDLNDSGKVTYDLVIKKSNGKFYIWGFEE